MAEEKKNPFIHIPWWVILAGFIINPGVGFGLIIARATGFTRWLYKMFSKAKVVRHRQEAKRFNRYMAVIGDRAVMPIERIAASLSMDITACERDLEYLIDNGYYNGVWTPYIDKELHAFVLDAEFAPEPPEKKPRHAKEEQPRPAVRAEEQPAPGEQPDSLPEAYRQKLREIRHANDVIADKYCSDAIDHIETITRSIFEHVNEHPEKEKQIQSFMNYYLPATLKLLNSYAELEKQPTAGENIVKSKERIEKTLERLVYAFDRQLNQLFESEAMDITTDIDVLEKMMAKDGLANDKYVLPKH